MLTRWCVFPQSPFLFVCPVSVGQSFICGLVQSSSFKLVLKYTVKLETLNSLRFSGSEIKPVRAAGPRPPPTFTSSYTDDCVLCIEATF